MSEERDTLEVLAVAGHGAAATAHALGVAYHVLHRDGKTRYALAHTAALAFDVLAAIKHARSR